MNSSEILQMFSFYVQSGPGFQRVIETAARPASLNRGEFFYLERDRCPMFALVGSGRLRVFKTNGCGREITLYRVKGGETCLSNLICTMLNCEAPVSALVEEDVKALVIPARYLRAWLGSQELVREFIFRNMANRLIGVMSLLADVKFGRMRSRLATFLATRFNPRPGVRLRELRITHEEIACELGTAREVISRLLRDLHREGAVCLSRGRISMLDSEAVRRYVSGG